jgi:hypothetical protein
MLLMHSGCQPGATPDSAGSTPVAGGPGQDLTGTPAAWVADPLMVANLKAHVVMLAETIGLRSTRYPEGYSKAAAYLESELVKLGYQVQRQAYEVDGHRCLNMWVERTAGKEVLVVGAHYDTCDRTPGADDNASGCAATLELARLLKDSKDGPTVRLVFFANEEPPYFQTEKMGSLVYARSCRQAGENLLGMISMESLGYFSDQPGSQNFPIGISGYPETGNFVGFVSDLTSQPFMQTCLKGFKKEGTIHAEGLAAPGMLSGIMWSDHWSFAECGYPALMITDTAPFRNPNYHMTTDTPDTLDYDRLAAVTEGTYRMIIGLGSRP